MAASWRLARVKSIEQPMQVLLPDWGIQAQVGPDRGKRIFGGVLAEQHHGCISGKYLRYSEDNQRNHQQCVADQRNTLEYIGWRHADCPSLFQARLGAFAPSDTKSRRNTAPRGCNW